MERIVIESKTLKSIIKSLKQRGYSLDKINNIIGGEIRNNIYHSFARQEDVAKFIKIVKPIKSIKFQGVI